MSYWKRSVSFAGICCEHCGTRLRPAIAPLLGIGTLLFFIYFVTSLIVPGVATLGGAGLVVILVLLAGMLPLERARD